MAVFSLSLKPDDPRPLSVQISETMRDHIIAGDLAPNSRLPSTRGLAASLGVSRSTVVEAYEQLTSEGFISGKPGAGMFVNDMGEVEDTGVRNPPKPLIDLTPASVQPSKMTPGLPDMSAFPYAAWGQCVSRLARTSPESLLNPESTFGLYRLRQEICAYVAEWRGIVAHPDQVVITAGAVEGLKMCLDSVGSVDQPVGLEVPCFSQVVTMARDIGRPIVALGMDEDGAMVPAQKLAQEMPLVVLTPSSQFPLGGAMPYARRQAFLAWAETAGAYVVEDDYDSEYRFAGRPIPALAQSGSRVIYMGTFSKVFSKPMRLGYLILPSPLVPVFEQRLKRMRSWASIMAQAPMAEFMHSGGMNRLIRRMRSLYKDRHRTVVAALDEAFGDRLPVQNHKAALHVVGRLSNQSEEATFIQNAQKNGFGLMPLSAMYWAGQPLYGALIGYAMHAAEDIPTLVAELRACLA